MEHDRTSGEPVQAPAHAVNVAPGSLAARDGTNAADAFHTTVEFATVGIAHLDLAGRFLYVNLALCQLTGYAREELLGGAFQEIIHPDDVPACLDRFSRLLAGARDETATCRLKRRDGWRDGPVVWSLITFALPPAAPGLPQFVIASIEDISERMQLEDQLRATNRRLALTARDSKSQADDLAATLDAMTDLVIVFDAAGHIRQVNQAVSDFMGLHPTLEAGRQFLGLRDGQGQPIPPNQLVSRRVLRGETLTDVQAVDVLASGVSRGDTLFNVNGAPVRDIQGRIVGGVLVMRDVTERRQLERRTQEALQALLQMAQALVAPAPDVPPPEEQTDASDFGSAPPLNPMAQRLAELTGRVLGCQRVGIVALGTDGALMRPIALTGLPSEQASAWRVGLNGRSMEAFIGPDRMRKLQAGETVELDLNQEPLRSVARGGPVALAAPLRVGDQMVGALALGYAREPHAYTEDELALAKALGQLAALVIERERLLQQREEARASELALQEANRRMDEFLGIAAHELRTPLTTLLGTVQLLERRLARVPIADRAPEDLADQLQMVRKWLTSMDQQGWRLSRLISDLVDTSRIKTGQLEIHAQPCDLATIVAVAVEEQRLANPQRVIDLALPKDAQTLVVGDADRLGQVVTNYLTNALKYSCEDSPVEARLSVNDDTARVFVRDEGPGLPPEEQPRVWELFHRAPDVEVRTGSGIGLGMGLHICKTIIERHGGRVGVDSAVGQGATFWFTLPLATDASASAASSL